MTGVQTCALPICSTFLNFHRTELRITSLDAPHWDESRSVVGFPKKGFYPEILGLKHGFSNFWQKSTSDWKVLGKFWDQIRNQRIILPMPPEYPLCRINIWKICIFFYQKIPIIIGKNSKKVQKNAKNAIFGKNQKCSTFLNFHRRELRIPLLDAAHWAESRSGVGFAKKGF